MDNSTNKLSAQKASAQVVVTERGITITGEFDGYEMAEMVTALQIAQKSVQRSQTQAEITRQVLAIAAKLTPILWPICLTVLISSVLFKAAFPEPVAYPSHSSFVEANHA